jgi:hypothetical protein
MHSLFVYKERTILATLIVSLKKQLHSSMDDVWLKTFYGQNLAQKGPTDSFECVFQSVA